MDNRGRIYLDKVEKKFLNKLKALSPEYEELDMDQIAHLKLKDALYNEIRERVKYKALQMRNNAALTPSGYTFLNKMRFFYRYLAVRIKLFLYGKAFFGFY